MRGVPKAVSTMHSGPIHHLPFVRRPTIFRAMPVLVSLAALMVALSACGQEAEPQSPPADPSPAALSQAASQTSTPTPAPPTPTPTLTPALTPIPSTFSPGDRSNGSRAPRMAPGFSLASAFGERVVLQDLLEEHEAVVLVFYRGFF